MYCQVRLFFETSVNVDTSEDPMEMKCALVSVCDGIVLDDSGEILACNIDTYLVKLSNIL